MRHEVDDLLDNTLQESAEILGPVAFNAAQLPLSASGGAMPAPVHDERLVWQIVSASHQVLLRSHRAPDRVLVAKAGLACPATVRPGASTACRSTRRAAYFMSRSAAKRGAKQD
ncbi:hypothetical protein ACVBEH_04260 [Roseateles sp. GG27B]